MTDGRSHDGFELRWAQKKPNARKRQKRRCEVRVGKQIRELLREANRVRFAPWVSPLVDRRRSRPHTHSNDWQIHIYILHLQYLAFTSRYGKGEGEDDGAELHGV